MNRTTQWACLIAGCLLLAYGFVRLYSEGDWTLLIISALIVAFSISSMLKSRQGGS